MTTRMILAATLILASSAEGRSLPVEGASVRLSLPEGLPVAESVFLNGEGPFRFLIDTGAQSNQVDRSLARRLKLASSFQTELATVSGTRVVAGGRVARVRLGTAEAADQEFLFTGLDGVQALSPDIQGVLGQEFLRHFDYLLDFRNRRLVFRAGPGEGARLPFEVVGGRAAVRTSEGELVLDSGAATAVLGRDASRIAPSATLQTATGSATVAVSGPIRLRIGDREYRPVHPALVPRSALDADGLLPLNLFRSVYVSNSEGYVVFD